MNKQKENTQSREVFQNKQQIDVIAINQVKIMFYIN